MNPVRLGKKLLFISFAITCALFISLQLLEATTTDGERIIIHKKLPVVELPKEHLFEKGVFLAAKNLLIKPENPLKLQDPKVKAGLLKLNGTGKPFVYLLSTDLYVLDKNCKILGLADSISTFNLPIISAANPLIKKSNYRIECEKVRQAVYLIKYLDKVNPLLSARLSEININSKMGLVSYFDWSKGIYVVFGKGKIANKVKNLESFYQELGQSRLIHNTKSLDLRYGGRIILKKTKV
jgi:hypothetical protein